MGDTVQIRPAQLHDAESLFALVRTFPAPTPPDESVFMSTLRAKLPDRASYVGVADLEGRLVGYVAGYSHPTFYAGGTTAWVDELLVETDFRGQGIGRRLMEAIERWAATRDCKLVSLATSGARSFYEHLGYQTGASYYKKYLIKPS